MTDLIQALTKATEYAMKRIEIPNHLLIELGAWGIKDVSGTNATYHDAITQALLDYFNGGSIVAPKNAVKQACRDAFADAFAQGWLEGSGELSPDSEGLQWLYGRTAEELANIDGLFETARDLRGREGFDYFLWASARADGYTSTVLSVYNQGVLMGKGNQMLTWHYTDGVEHCDTCEHLDGERHRASWYISHEYIPRKPGANLICQGYNCQCYLTDDSGAEITL